VPVLETMPLPHIRTPKSALSEQRHMQGGCRATGDHEDPGSGLNRPISTQLIHALSRKAGCGLQATVADGGNSFTAKHDPRPGLASGQPDGLKCAV
jgi:hypothetical protein